MMRTNVVINDRLMEDALKTSGIKTKKDVIEEGLKLLVRFNRQKSIRQLRGKIKWDGDLNAMRTDK
jgi:Arc/MetJ family transcription regulator